MAAGKRFSFFTAGAGNILQAVLYIVHAERGANIRCESALFVTPLRRTVMTHGLIHCRFQRAIGEIAGTGFFKTTADAGFGHQRGALSNFLNTGKDLLHVGHFRSANQIQHFSLRLHHVGRHAAGIGNGVVHTRFLDNMLIEEVTAGGHQRDGVQRATPKMR